MKNAVAKTIDPLAAFIPLIRAAAAETKESAVETVHRALRTGHVLNQAKLACGHGNFLQWVEGNIPEINLRTAQRWMGAAANVIACSKVNLALLPEPFMEMDVVSLSEEAAEERQMLLGFLEDKTIKDCLMGVVTEGDEPHRITRAHNGRNAKQTRGDERKDYPKFIGLHLSDAAAHLKSFLKFTAPQIERLEVVLKSFIHKCPSPVLETLKKTHRRGDQNPMNTSDGKTDPRGNCSLVWRSVTRLDS